jgi:hypothetical protein
MSESLDDAKRAELLRTVFSSVVLSGEGVVGAVPHPEFREILEIGARPSGKALARAARAALGAASSGPDRPLDPLGRQAEQ